MKVCLKNQIATILFVSGSTHAFMVATHVSHGKDLKTLLNALPEKVEVCGFKDCRSNFSIGLSSASTAFGYCQSWRWSQIRETGELGVGGKQSCGYDQGRRMRLPGRMRLWTEPTYRWQNGQQGKGERCCDQSSGHRSCRICLDSFLDLFCFMKRRPSMTIILFFYVVVMMFSIEFAHGLTFPGVHYSMSAALCFDTRQRVCRQRTSLKNDLGDNMEDSSLDENDDKALDRRDDEIMIDGQQEDLVTLSDLDWRVEKMRLEEANTRRFLKAGPRFLPYEECRKWVMAWNRWDTEEEWKSWIDEGEKRNSYIPARPDEYYGRLGKWRGWQHFLGKDDDLNKSDRDGIEAEYNYEKKEEDIGDFQ